MRRKVVEFLFCRAWKTDLESEWMINLKDLWLAIMFMARSIAVTSTLQIEDSFGRHFSSSWFWKITAQPTFIPAIDVVVIWEVVLDVEEFLLESNEVCFGFGKFG